MSPGRPHQHPERRKTKSFAKLLAKSFERIWRTGPENPVPGDQTFGKGLVKFLARNFGKTGVLGKILIVGLSISTLKRFDG